MSRNLASVTRPIRDGVPYGEEPDKTGSSGMAYHSCSACEYGIVHHDKMRIQ